MTAPKPVTAYAAVSPDGEIAIDAQAKIEDELCELRLDLIGYTVIPVTIIPTEQYVAMVDAFTQIDALDPESKIHACSADAVRGLVLRMGEIARNVLAALKEQDHA